MQGYCMFSYKTVYLLAIAAAFSFFSVTHAAAVRDAVQELIAHQFDTTSPALMNPEIARYAQSVRTALVQSPEALAAFATAFAPFTQANLTAKEYCNALAGLRRFTKNEAFRVLDKDVRRAFGRLVYLLRAAVKEFIRLRPFILVDPRVSAARLLQQQKRARRVANAAAVMASLTFAAALAGGTCWAVKKTRSRGPFSELVSSVQKAFAW